MFTYALVLRGVTGINEVQAGIEHRMNNGMALDDQCEDRGYHIGTQVRRNLRESIRQDAQISMDLWDLFERAHINGECEHKNCKVNEMEITDVMDSVSDRKRELQMVIDHANEMDAEAGDEIHEEPPSLENPMEILKRILGNSNLN